MTGNVCEVKSYFLVDIVFETTGLVPVPRNVEHRVYVCHRKWFLVFHRDSLCGADGVLDL